MILIGTMNLTRTQSRGDFYCPTCGSLREYRLRSRRPFLTLYLIPVIPIGPAEQFVQCNSCKSNSPLVALEHDERSFRESQALQFRRDAFQSAAMAATAGGTITQGHIETLLDLGNRLLSEGVDREQLGALCSSIRLNRITPRNYIASVSRAWSAEQRRLALQIIFVAASASGELEPAQLALLSWLREHWGMSEREYQWAIEEAVERGADVAGTS